MAEIVYLLFGSNLEDREANLISALKDVSEYQNTKIIRISSLYETEPVGMEEESSARNFLNMCCALETALGPFKLFALVQKTEQKLGRDRTKGNAVHKSHNGLYLSRTIDIDILMYGERILCTKELIIPHPRFHERLFALEPLAEIAGTVVHPLFRLTVHELKYRNTDKHFIKYFKGLKDTIYGDKRIKGS